MDASALYSLPPDTEVLQDFHSSCESGGTQLFSDFAGSFTTGIIFPQTLSGVGAQDTF